MQEICKTTFVAWSNEVFTISRTLVTCEVDVYPAGACPASSGSLIDQQLPHSIIYFK